MGLFDDLLASLSPEARKRLAKEAASRAVKGVGDAVYEKVDQVREELEAPAKARREAQARAEQERAAAAEAETKARAKAAKARDDAQAIEDELAALKKKIGG